MRQSHKKWNFADLDENRDHRHGSLTRSTHQFDEAEQKSRDEYAHLYPWRATLDQGHERYAADEDDHITLHRTVITTKHKDLQLRRQRLLKQKAYINHEKKRLILLNALLKSENERYETSLTSTWFCSQAFESSTSLNKHILLHIDGKVFEISRELATKDEGSLLAALAADDSPLSIHEEGCFRFDRNWWLFRCILQFLRDGKLPTDLKLLRSLYMEAGFWYLESLRSAIEERDKEFIQRKCKIEAISLDREASNLFHSPDYKNLATSNQNKKWWHTAPKWWGYIDPPPSTEKTIQESSKVKSLLAKLNKK